MPTPAANRAWLREDGIIEVDYVGNQSAEAIVSVSTTSAEIVRTLTEQKHPVYFLLDLTKMGKVPLRSRVAGSRGQRDVPFDRVAIYGASKILRYLMLFMITVRRKTSSVQLFTDRKAAEHWLAHG